MIIMIVIMITIFLKNIIHNLHSPAAFTCIIFTIYTFYKSHVLLRYGLFRGSILYLLFSLTRTIKILSTIVVNPIRSRVRCRLPFSARTRFTPCFESYIIAYIIMISIKDAKTSRYNIKFCA